MPTYERMRRYEGGWHLERKLMFPANIFLESEEEELLKQEIKKYCSFTGRKIQMKSISIEEEKFLKKLCGEMACNQRYSICNRRPVKGIGESDL